MFVATLFLDVRILACRADLSTAEAPGSRYAESLVRSLQRERQRRCDHPCIRGISSSPTAKTFSPGVDTEVHR